MPKIPRDCSHDRLVRFLKKRGWQIEREGGRHTILGRDDVELSVPRHTKLKTGTVASILRQAGIDPDDATKNL
jgi:predicted RNA binding protein YcfA (HicA-like mRNA interferase family)